MRTLLKNVKAVVTCNDRDEVLYRTDVWLYDGRIEKIGHLDAYADRAFDAANMLLYPGLVNTHHHLYQYFTRNFRPCRAWSCSIGSKHSTRSGRTSMRIPCA